MDFNIDEQAMQEYVQKRMRSAIDQQVSLIIREWDFYRSVDERIRSVVLERITDDAVAKIMSELDRQTLIDMISKSLAEGIAYMLQKD